MSLQPATAPVPGTAASGAAQAGARARLQAHLDARRFPEAYDEAQKLLEADPRDPTSLLLLGHACFGLGLFEEAEACFRSARDRVPSEEAVWWLSWLTIARGDEDEARLILTEAVTRGASWKLYELLLSITPSLDEQLEWIEHHRQRSPGDETAGRLEASLRARVARSPRGRIVAGAREVVQARLSDRFLVTARVQGLEVPLRLDVAATGLEIGDDLVRKLELTAAPVSGVSEAGTGIGTAGEVVVGRLELGALALEGVPTRVVPAASLAEGARGTIGPGLLSGYTWRLDRKQNVLELYPAAVPPPPPTRGAVVQRYYRLGRQLLTDAVVHNRVDGQAWKVKMRIDPSTPRTSFDRGHAERLQFGKIKTSSVRPLKGAGLTQQVEVTFSEVQLAGQRFIADRFATGETADRLVPSYGCVGQDLLRRFRMTLDPRRHQIVFEAY